MDRDAHVHDRRDARDVRDVLPRLSDRSDAPASRASRALDMFANAQKLPSYSIHAQQQLLHQDQKQQQHSQHQQQSPTHPSPQQASELPLPLSASSSAPFQSSNRHYFQQKQPPSYTHNANGSDSQDTTSSADTSASTDTDQLFTPPISEGELSVGGGGSGSVNGSANAYNFDHDFSSQESQLHHLSRLAASRERMADVTLSDAFDGGALSRKRAADGSVKHTRNTSSTSPIYMGGHSRNTSAVSIASTAGSRIGELSAELKTRLSYAMVKVNNGWQSHSIDQVENFASHGASPASSTSTIHGRHGSSLSPRIPGHSFHNRHQSQTSVSTSTTIALPNRGLSILDTSPWSSQQSSRSAQSTPPLPSPLATSRSGSTAPTRTLAPPASIQPSRPSTLGRRNSNPVFVPPALPTAYSHQGSPHTPAAFEGGHHRTPTADPILYTPHQNVREQDAIETLLFMSSPGNSSNMKQFPPITSSSQPLPAGHHDPQQHSSMTSPQRHALPGSAPRKSLPSGRPNTQSFSSQPPLSRRGGHNRSPSEMDIDEPYGTPNSRSVKGTPKRRTNGAFDSSTMLSPRMKVPLSMPSGLSGTSKPRPAIGEDDIEKMLDRAAAASADDSSDSESEILIPSRRTNHVGI